MIEMMLRSLLLSFKPLPICSHIFYGQSQNIEKISKTFNL